MQSSAAIPVVKAVKITKPTATAKSTTEDKTKEIDTSEIKNIVDEVKIDIKRKNKNLDWLLKNKEVTK